MSSIHPSHPIHPRLGHSQSRHRFLSPTDRRRRTGNFTAYPPSGLGAGLIGFMIFVATVGLSLTSFLSWLSLTSSKIAGCGGGQWFDCNHVLTSKWSTAFGIPVGIPAAALYVIILISLVSAVSTTNRQLRVVSMNVISYLALSAGFASLWFIYLQVFVVQHLCAYCLAAHTCGLLLSGIVLWKMPLGIGRTSLLAVAGLIAVGVMASSQLMAKPPLTYEIQSFPAELPIDGEIESFIDNEKALQNSADAARPDNETANQSSLIIEAPVDAAESVKDETIFEAPDG